MKQNPVDVSVIIVNWNTRDLLAQCLHSVYETQGGLVIQVIVVDNGSTDSSVEMVRQDFSQVELLTNQENLGFVRGNNQAFPLARGRHVLLLNSDAALQERALAQMTDFLDQHPGVGIVGPMVLNPDGSFQTSFMDFPNLVSETLLMTKLSKLVYSRHYPSYPPEKSQQTRPVDWMQGACMMMRRRTLEEIGGLDETFFMYSEEVDWCWRSKQAGWEVYYLPAARIMHWGGQSSARVPAKRRVIVYKSKLLFLGKHYGPGTASLFRGALLTTSFLKMGLWGLVRFLAPGRRKQASENLRSYRMLIRDLVKLPQEG